MYVESYVLGYDAAEDPAHDGSVASMPNVYRFTTFAIEKADKIILFRCVSMLFSAVLSR